MNKRDILAELENGFIAMQAERDFAKGGNENPYYKGNPSWLEYEQAWEAEADKYLIKFHAEQH